LVDFTTYDTVHGEAVKNKKNPPLTAVDLYPVHAETLPLKV